MIVVVGILFALAALALIARAWMRHLRSLYLLLTGRVPMHRIVRSVVLLLALVVVLYPSLLYWERNSPLHREIKPEAENRVRSSVVAQDLIGDGIIFGSEWSFSAHEEGVDGSGDLSFSARGSKSKGEVEVTALKKNGTWSLGSITLEANKKQVPIPVN